MTVFPFVLALVVFSVEVSTNSKVPIEMSIKENKTLTYDSNDSNTESEDTSSRNPCPKRFTILRDRRRKIWCVFIGNNRVTWFEALLTCKFVVKDGILMELYDPVIAKNVQTLVYKHDEVERYRGYWVGGTNMLDNSTFVWNHFGLPINRTLWDSSEPSYTKHAEYCAELRAWNGKLNDDECHALKYYVCGKCINA